jgi:hypothetical protein
VVRRIICLIALLYAAPLYAQNALSGTACPGAGCVTIDVRGMGTLGLQVSSTFAGTLVFEQTVLGDASTPPGASWVSLSALPNGSQTGVTQTTATGFWTATVAGARYVRVRFSPYTSGSATVTGSTASAKAGGGGAGGNPFDQSLNTADSPTFNALTVSSCAGCGGGGGITIANTQVAVGSGVNTVGGSANFTTLVFGTITSPVPSGQNNWMGVAQSTLDATTRVGFDGGQGLTMSLEGGASDTPWIGLLIQAEQLVDNQDIVGSYNNVFLKGSGAATSGTIQGTGSNIFVDLPIAAQATNQQLAYEGSATTQGQGYGKMAVFSANMTQQGAGAAADFTNYDSYGVSITSGSVVAFTGLHIRAPFADSSPSTFHWGIHIDDFSSVTSGVNRPIDYKGSFIVDATGATTTPNVISPLWNGKTFTLANSFITAGNFAQTFTATGTANVQVGSGGVVAYAANNLSVFAATTSAQLAGVVSDEVGTGALMFGTNPKIASTTVAGLPTCNGASKDTRSAVTDALAPSFLVTVVGGGAIYSPVTCNGTNWVAE